jgi:hypothetical protein
MSSSKLDLQGSGGVVDELLSHPSCSDPKCRSLLNKARAELRQASFLIGQLEQRRHHSEQLMDKVGRRLQGYPLRKDQELETVV